MIDLLECYIPPFHGDIILTVVFGGVLSGAGLGLIYMRGGTTGGTELIARLVGSKFQHVPIGRLILLVDAIVVASSARVYRNFQSALYAIIYIYVSTALMDTLIYGKNKGKMLLIVTKAERQAAAAIMQRIQRGVTILKGAGAYTGMERQILLCAIRPSEVSLLRTLVYDIDPSAFVVVLSTDEVRGEGFRPLIKYRVDYLLPSAYTTLLHRSDNTLVNLSVLLRKNGDKTANFVSVGFAVNGTAGFYHRQPATAYRRGNIFFFNEDHGTYKTEFPPRELGYGRKASDCAAREHIHQKGLGGVILVVPERNDITACHLRRFVKRPPTHPCAKAAGIGFFTFLKNDFPQPRPFDYVGYLQLLAKRCDRGIIVFFSPETGIKGNCRNLKRKAIKTAQSLQHNKQSNAVLAAREPHRDMVARLYHFISFDCRLKP